MDDLVRMNVMLDISAQKIIQQVKFHNAEIETLIAEGLSKVMTDFTVDENKFIEHISNCFKDEINKTIKSVLNEWSFREKIKTKFESIIDGKMDEISDIVIKNIINEKI